MLALRVVVALGAVLGVLWFLQRRFGAKQKTRAAKETITLIGRKGLGGKAQLVVVEAEGRRYVLGVSEGGVTVVDTLEVDDGAHTGTMTSTATSPLLPVPTDDFGRALALAADEQKPHSGLTLPRWGGGLVLPSDVWGRLTGFTRRGADA